MGIATDLGYEYRAPTWVQRVVARIGTTRAISSVSRVVMPGLDRFTLKLTGGRSTATTWLLGIPTLWVTTLGARSGEPRRVPLFGIPIDDDLALLGTRFGYPSTPSWVFNIEANPDVDLAYRGREAPGEARVPTGTRKAGSGNARGRFIPAICSTPTAPRIAESGSS